MNNKEGRILRYNRWKIYIPTNFLILMNEIHETYVPLKLFVQEKQIFEPSDLKTRRINKAPLMITLMLTNNCCTHCCYCYADTKTKISHHVSTKRTIEIIREAKKLQLYNINIIGGEIFLYKDWPLILKEIIKNGFMPEIISTKVPITKSIISKIKTSGFTNNLQLSIDSLEPNLLHKTLLVDLKYVDNVKYGIQLLEENHIPYQIGTVLTKWTATKKNINELFSFLSDKKYLQQWEIRSMVYSLGKENINFQHLKASRKNLNELYLFIENKISPLCTFRIKTSRDELKKQYRTEKRGCRYFKGSHCSALNSHAFILPDGNVTICEQLYWNPDFIIGNIEKSSLEEIWNSPRALALANLERCDINSQSACKTCNHFNMCFHIDRNRCWSDIIKAYGKEKWDYPDPRCSRAPLMLHNITYNK